MSRKSAASLGDLMLAMLKTTPLGREMSVRRIYDAWNEVSGAGAYTLRRYYREGKLYITVSSSVVRSQLYMQRDVLREKINARLAADELYLGASSPDGPVHELILK